MTTTTIPTLADAIALALDALPRNRLDAATGEQRRWPVTAQRIKAHLMETYGDQWKPAAIDYWIERMQKQQKRERFDELQAMPASELGGRLRAAETKIARAVRAAEVAPTPEIKTHYQKQAAQAQNYRLLLAYEQTRRADPPVETPAPIVAEGTKINNQPLWDAALKRHKAHIAAGCIPPAGAIRVGAGKQDRDNDDTPPAGAGKGEG